MKLKLSENALKSLAKVAKMKVKDRVRHIDFFVDYGMVWFALKDVEGLEHEVKALKSLLQEWQKVRR